MEDHDDGEEEQEEPVKALTGYIQLLHQNHTQQVFSSLAKLVLSDDPAQQVWKDVTFVCSGGQTIRWNSLLASMWSSVVRYVVLVHMHKRKLENLIFFSWGKKIK